MSRPTSLAAAETGIPFQARAPYIPWLRVHILVPTRSRMLTNLLTDNLASTKALFTELLDFRVEFEADWFISLVGPEGSQLGIMLRTSEFVPEAYQQPAQGVMITLVVDGVDRYYEKANQFGLQIVEAPRDLPYGQRRLLIRDASGALIDVSSPTAPLDPEYS